MPKDTKKKTTRKKATRKRAPKKTPDTEPISPEGYAALHQYSELLANLQEHTKGLRKIETILKDLPSMHSLIQNMFRLQDRIEETLTTLSQSQSLAIKVGDAAILSLFITGSSKDIPKEEKEKILIRNIINAIKEYPKMQDLPKGLRESLLEGLMHKEPLE